MNAHTMNPTLTVFTKPWPDLSLPDLADQVASWGFNGVELPVRPGFQVEPDGVEEWLVEAQLDFRDRDLQILSVAGNLDAKTIRACGAADVPFLRVMLRIDPELGYRASVAKFQERVSKLTPLLRDSDVVIGLQNHNGPFVGSAVGLMEALDPLDPACAQAVLDLAHTALAGEPADLAIDVARPRLAMVNLKNAVRREVGRDDHGGAKWAVHWGRATEGFLSWSDAVGALRRARYDGPLCLTAEYHGNDGRPLKGDPVVPLIREDLAYLKRILAADGDLKT
jgi:sugar phosphate isomerase/epimerase